MMRVERRGIPALVARPSYHAALRERLKMDRLALRGHPFWQRLEELLAEVEHAYASPASRPTVPPQRRSEHEDLREQYAPLFWHYLGRALRAAGEVEFIFMEARIRCLLREFQAETGRPLSDGLKA
jgi:hypothetical protein